MPAPRRSPALLAMSLLALALGAPAAEGEAQTVHACYVPSSGTVYRIKTTDTKETCASDKHVEFSWTSAAGADHGALAGLADDDHPQYILAEGVRTVTNGFALRGTYGVGSPPATGPGIRLMWYPGQAAFRAGAAFQTQWDAANIGEFSTAFGFNTTANGMRSFAAGAATVASGAISTAMGVFSTATGYASTALGEETTASDQAATAMGRRTVASGQYSTAMGIGSRATGHYSTAMGSGAVASNLVAVAIGHGATASGDRSMALGTLASTNGHAGSLVYGDLSTFLAGGAVVSNTAANQFMVRAAGGTIFYSNAALTAGVTLAPGGGAWASVSNALRKENFRDVDGDEVLGKLAAIPIREWNYKSQDSTIRHLGPTAQDFFAAFGLGGSDTTITTIDADGVSLLAIQALERRTTELRTVQQALDARTKELEALRSEVAALRDEVAALLGNRAGRGRQPSGSR